MGFNSLQELTDSINNGQSSYTVWRKSPVQATSAGIWTDLSMSPGNPVPNYYASAPLISDVLTNGLYTGPLVDSTGKTKHLRVLSVLTAAANAVPMPMILCDYLMYYPFIDQSTTDEQVLENTITLPRYTTGEGVQVMAVLVATQTGGQSFQIRYTNSDGVTDRISQTVVCNSATSTGTIVQTATATNRGNGPFIPLQRGDKGVRSVESVTFNGADVGLITLVLVKPLASLMVREITAPVEVDFLRDRPVMPRIYDNAYLNFIAMPNASLASTSIFGEISCAWG